MRILNFYLEILNTERYKSNIELIFATEEH